LIPPSRPQLLQSNTLKLILGDNYFHFIRLLLPDLVGIRYSDN